MGLISGGGSGGGGLPSQWTDGGNGNVIARVDDTTKTPFRIIGIANQDADLLRIDSDGGDTPIQIESVAGNLGDLRLNSGPGLHDVNVGSYHDISLTPARRVVIFTAFVLGTINAAPADATLAAGDCALWYDQTNGASKLMVKAKQANGTVKTAAVALA